jgi:hypothetical protein
MDDQYDESTDGQLSDDEKIPHQITNIKNIWDTF